MTHRMSLKCMHLQLALWASVALLARTAAHAQAHSPAPEPPDLRLVELSQDRLSDEEMKVASPCRRSRDVLKDRDTWKRLGWLAFCVQGARSRVLSEAWEKGLDEYGVNLEADAKSRKLSDTELWLRRLPGKYRIEGTYWATVWNSYANSPLGGTADCFGVGTGPGITCLISTDWKSPKETYKDPYVDTNLHDAMRKVVLLFGVDPGTQQIRVTLVDFRAVGMFGLLDEGTVMFTRRPNFDYLSLDSALVTYTWGPAIVTTRQDGDLEMKIMAGAINTTTLVPMPGTYLFNMQLHRELAVKER